MGYDVNGFARNSINFGEATACDSDGSDRNPHELIF